MSKNIMMATLILISILFGAGAFLVIKIISRRVKSKPTACAYSCVLEMALMAVLYIVAYYVIPAVNHHITYIIGGSKHMRTIYVDWIGFANLVKSEAEIPTPKEFVLAMDGYRCFKTPDGIYAIEE